MEGQHGKEPSLIQTSYRMPLGKPGEKLWELLRPVVAPWGILCANHGSSDQRGANDTTFSMTVSHLPDH